MTADARVTVHGELDWHGYVLRCKECGSADGWQLHAYEDALGDGHRAGEIATATCAGCREICEHPLVYPGMVRALANAAHGGDAEPADVIRVLDGIRWRPHSLHVQYPDNASTLEEHLSHGVLLWLPWEEPGQQFGKKLADPWWVWRSWPDLLATVNGLPIPQPPPYPTS